MRRPAPLQILLLRVAALATVATSAGLFTLTLASCEKEIPPLPPDYDCDCEEPVFDPEFPGDDGDAHQEFDLRVEAAFEPASVALKEQQGFRMTWMIGYDWTPCTKADTESTAGHSGEFTLRYTLKDSRTNETLDGPHLVSYDLLMGTEMPDFRESLGVDVPAEASGTRALELVVELLVNEDQECSEGRNGESPSETESRLLGNNVAYAEAEVEDCPCTGGFDSMTPGMSGFEWDASASELSWFSNYVIVACGQDGTGLETGAFDHLVTVRSASTGATLLPPIKVPGASLVAGDPPLPYSVTIPASALADGPVSIRVDMRSFTGGAVTCDATSPLTETIDVP